MTVFRHPRGKSFRFDFRFRGTRYTGNTYQTTRDEALIFEAHEKKQLRLQLAGLVPPAPITSPNIQEWAEVYLADARRRPDITRPDRIAHLLAVVLRFFGAKPSRNAVAGAPYHDLCLHEVIDDPLWVVKFEQWMATRPIAGQTRNQYRSVMRQLYALASQPAYRTRTRVTVNPFDGLRRDPVLERTVTVSVEELTRWLSHASYHVRLAAAIAALAPKLRLANILALRWDRHVDPELRYLTIAQHKTATKTGRPLVVPIDAQLRDILLDAKARKRPRVKYVVTYRGKPIKSIRDGVQAAAEAAGLTYARQGGVTFHTIRHTMATLLAELSALDGGAALSESLRQSVMGHASLSTTQRYTHIRPAPEQEALARLSQLTPIKAVVTAPWTRATRSRRKGTSTGNARSRR